MEQLFLAETTEEPPSLSQPQPLLDAGLVDAELANAAGQAEGRQQRWPLSLKDDPASWGDWRWQLRNRLRSIEDLKGILGFPAREQAAYDKLVSTFHYSIPPYYASLIDWTDPLDPIRQQCVPDLRELDYTLVGNEDPLEEKEDMQVPGLVHRYPDRVLAVVTGTCAMYCRHCTRKRIWHEGETARTKDELLAMAQYVRSTPAVREVVVSGGDPLLMPLELLDWFLGELRTIDHVEVVRIGTRVPVVLPMRITDDVARVLRSHRPLWLNTQFNHPREVTPEAAEACDRILCAGIPVSNQSVLLRGINDTVSTMRSLCHALQRISVRPYYLYQCDPVTGVEHFRTNLWKGVEIIEALRGHTGGLCVPSFVVDAPGGGGKIPLQPFYLMSASEREVLLRNYEGLVFKYYNPSGIEPPASPALPRRNGNGNGKKASQAPMLLDARRQSRRKAKQQPIEQPPLIDDGTH